MADEIRVQDFPSGHDGKAYINLNGDRVEAFWIKKINARLEPIVENSRPLGQRMTQNAVRGLAGKGDMTYCNATTAFLKAYREYKNGGDLPDVDLQYYSDAETGEYDRVEVSLSGVILATIGMGALDDSSDNTQTQDSAFTFDDYDIL